MGTATGPTTTPVPKGCPSGIVAITHYAAWTDPSKVCIRAGARLWVTLPLDGPEWSWGTGVLPQGAAVVTSVTGPKAVVDVVTPERAAPFCLALDYGSTVPTNPVSTWQLCVTIRR
jgi:hypothetical protein